MRPTWRLRDLREGVEHSSLMLAFLTGGFDCGTSRVALGI